jgi:ABC-2 type transport system permease protein
VISKDVIRIVKIALRMGFYLTPVLYSLSEVESRHSGFGTVFALNPMAGIMSLYRAAFWPEDAPPPILVGSSVVLSLLALAVGLFLFRRLEGQVLKEI